VSNPLTSIAYIKSLVWESSHNTAININRERICNIIFDVWNFSPWLNSWTKHYSTALTNKHRFYSQNTLQHVECYVISCLRVKWMSTFYVCFTVGTSCFVCFNRTCARHRAACMCFCVWLIPCALGSGQPQFSWVASSYCLPRGLFCVTVSLLTWCFVLAKSKQALLNLELI